MKQFLAIYTGSSTSPAMAAWNALDPQTQADRQQRAGIAWHKWMTDNGPAIVTIGGPLGKTRLVSPAGISDTSNSLGGFVIVQAASHDDAAQMFVDHPHFTLFPGDGVEVMEIMPIPTGF